MKKILCGWFSILLAVCFTAISFAKATGEVSAASKYEVIEANYLAGLTSDNTGLKVSCAYFLGEMKSEKALIPLMKIFRDEKDNGAKLVIAWSLLKIGDARGVYLVKQEAESKDCCQIRYMLVQLYNDYSLKNFGKID